LVLDEPQENETSIQVNGIDVLIDEDIKDLADRTRIDLISTPYGNAFTVEVAGAAGC
jgi:Fe-S cluster assembly iron-binding protein IscA